MGGLGHFRRLPRHRILLLEFLVVPHVHWNFLESITAFINVVDGSRGIFDVLVACSSGVSVIVLSLLGYE